MNISKIAKTAVLSGALLSAPLSIDLAAERDTSDILIDVLVMKGILTEAEATTIRQEVEVVVAAEREEVVEAAVAASTAHVSSPVTDAIPMPSKLDKLKFYSDARFRFQGEDTDSKDTRTRFRYRLRAGVDAAFKDTGYSMGVRLETASANDSTNATLGGFFDKAGDELFVGLAYLGWEGDDVEINLGKHKNPFVMDKAFWDGDINPEGISESFTAGDVTYTFGQYIVSDEREDKSGSESDAFLLGAQAVFQVGDLAISPMLLTTTSDDAGVPEVSGNFKGENSNTFFDDFFVLQVPMTYKVEGGKIFGTIGINLEADTMNANTVYYGGDDWNGGDEDLFFNLGYKHGSAKKPGQSEWSVEYRHIEGASYTPNLSDSDFAKNSLNHSGFVLKYKYAVTDFFTIGGAYMDSSAIEGAYQADVVAKDEVQLLQVDAAVKF